MYARQCPQGTRDILQSVDGDIRSIKKPHTQTIGILTSMSVHVSDFIPYIEYIEFPRVQLPDRGT